MRRRWFGALLLGVLLCAGSAARADVRTPPFKVSIQGRPHPAEPGSIYSDVLKIRFGEEAVVSDIGLAGNGWTIASLAAPLPGRSRPVTTSSFRSPPPRRNPTRLVVLRWSRTGRSWRQVIDLSPEACRRAPPPSRSRARTRWCPRRPRRPANPGTRIRCCSSRSRRWRSSLDGRPSPRSPRRPPPRGPSP